MKPVAIYKIVPGYGSFLAVTEEGEIISEGVDLRGEKEAIACIQDAARDRGWVVEVIREGGKFERAEARVDISQMEYSSPALRAADGFGNLLVKMIQDRAAEMAASEGRSVVQSGDVYAAALDAISGAEALIKDLGPAELRRYSR